MNENQWLQSKNPDAMLAYLEGQISRRKMRLFLCACCRRLWDLVSDPRSQRAIEAIEAAPGAAKLSQAVIAAAEVAAEEAEVRRVDAQAERDRARDADQDARQDARETDVSPALLLERAAEAARAEAAAQQAEACARVARAVLSPDSLILLELAETAGLLRDAALYRWQAAMFQQRADREADRPPRRSRAGRAARLVQVYQWIEDAWEETQNKVEAIGRRGERVERAAQAALLRDIVGNPFGPTPKVTRAWLAWNEGTVKKLAQGIYEEMAFERMPILADALEDAGCTDTLILEHCRQPGEHARGCWVIDLLTGQS